jgi:hypothetical protein
MVDVVAEDIRAALGRVEIKNTRRVVCANDSEDVLTTLLLHVEVWIIRVGRKNARSHSFTA